jgi:hypothetical protein
MVDVGDTGKKYKLGQSNLLALALAQSWCLKIMLWLGWLANIIWTK